MENWQRAGFGVYVHWPFCAAKCPYCDFNSHVSDSIDQNAWLEGFQREIAAWAEAMPSKPPVSSVFFGGGTPSLMDPKVVDGILSALRSNWAFVNDVEITLEANPTSVEASRFAEFRNAGVNRFSIGIQALRDDALRALGRLHSAKEARRAYDVARHLTDRVSFDLIYARQFQTAAEWEEELREALGTGPTHLSLYQLTIEPETAFGARAARGRLPGLPGEDLAVDLWEVTQGLTSDAGLHRYETSNHCVPGEESRHNLIYWRGGDWLGLGPGAHGRVALATGRAATVAPLAPAIWLDGTTSGIDQVSIESLQVSDIIDEYFLGSLRLREGLDLSLVRTFGQGPDPAVVDRLISDGLLTLANDRLMATDRGALLLNTIVAELLTG